MYVYFFVRELLGTLGLLDCESICVKFVSYFVFVLVRGFVYVCEL